MQPVLINESLKAPARVLLFHTAFHMEGAHGNRTATDVAAYSRKRMTRADRQYEYGENTEVTHGHTAGNLLIDIYPSQTRASIRQVYRRLFSTELVPCPSGITGFVIQTSFVSGHFARMLVHYVARASSPPRRSDQLTKALHPWPASMVPRLGKWTSRSCVNRVTGGELDDQ